MPACVHEGVGDVAARRRRSADVVDVPRRRRRSTTVPDGAAAAAARRRASCRSASKPCVTPMYWPLGGDAGRCTTRRRVCRSMRSAAFARQPAGSSGHDERVGRRPPATCLATAATSTARARAAGRRAARQHDHERRSRASRAAQQIEIADGLAGRGSSREFSALRAAVSSGVSGRPSSATTRGGFAAGCSWVGIASLGRLRRLRPARAASSRRLRADQPLLAPCARAPRPAPTARGTARASANPARAR